MRRQNWTFAALKMPTKVPAYIAATRAIIAAATGNPSLPDVRPISSALRAAVDDLAAAERETLTKTTGTATARDATLKPVRDALDKYKSYVQDQANANPEEAAAIIEGAGLSVRLPSTRRKPWSTAKPGPTSGTAILEVRAPAKRASYERQWSDDGGKTWNDAPVTLQSRTTIHGLPVGKYVLFRFRVATKNGIGDWSEPIPGFW